MKKNEKLILAIVIIGALAYASSEGILFGQFFQGKDVLYPKLASLTCRYSHDEVDKQSDILEEPPSWNKVVCGEKRNWDFGTCRLTAASLSLSKIREYYPEFDGRAALCAIEVKAPDWSEAIFIDRGITFTGPEWTLGQEKQIRAWCLDLQRLKFVGYEVPFTRTIQNDGTRQIFKIEWDPAGQGAGFIPNSEGCVFNELVVSLLGEKNPISIYEDEFMNAIQNERQLSGLTINPPDYKGVVKMYPAETYWFIDYWDVLPAINVNPMGQYQGMDVIATFNKLYKVEPITLNNGEIVYMPTQELTKPPNYCTSTTVCGMIGHDYQCVDYQCQEVEPGGKGQVCSVYFPCPDSIYRVSEGKFYEKTWKCVGGYCEEQVEKEIACTPGYCTQFNQWCDKEKGCQDITVRKCGNGVIDAGETCGTCYEDIVAVKGFSECCGNGIIEAGETCTTCPEDIGEEICGLGPAGVQDDYTWLIIAAVVIVAMLFMLKMFGPKRGRRKR